MSHEVFEIPHFGVISVFHKLVKRSTIPQVKSKQNAPSNLRGIVNALGALEYNGLENNYLFGVPLPSTDSVKLYRNNSHKSLPEFTGRYVIALGWQTNKFFPPRLLITVFPLFLHPSVLLDFGAPNPVRHHIECSRCQLVGRLGGLPLALEGWCFWPQRMGVVETRMGTPMRIPGVSAAEMAG